MATGLAKEEALQVCHLTLLDSGHDWYTWTENICLHFRNYTYGSIISLSLPCPTPVKEQLADDE